MTCVQILNLLLLYDVEDDRTTPLFVQLKVVPATSYAPANHTPCYLQLLKMRIAEAAF